MRTMQIASPIHIRHLTSFTPMYSQLYRSACHVCGELTDTHKLYVERRALAQTSSMSTAAAANSASPPPPAVLTNEKRLARRDFRSSCLFFLSQSPEIVAVAGKVLVMERARIYSNKNSFVKWHAFFLFTFLNVYSLGSDCSQFMHNLPRTCFKKKQCAHVRKEFPHFSPPIPRSFGAPYPDECAPESFANVTMCHARARTPKGERRRKKQRTQLTARV